MKAITRVYIVEDHELFRVGLRQIIDEAPEFECVGESDNLIECLSRIRATKTDVVLLDMHVNGENSLKIIRALRSIGQHPLICVLTNYFDRELVHKCVSAGVNAYLMKDGSREGLLETLGALKPGRFYGEKPVAEVPESIAPPPKSFLQITNLSPRELQCLPHLVSGKRSEEIAAELGITLNTLKNHRKSIYRKLDVHSKTEMMLVCREVGIL